MVEGRAYRSQYRKNVMQMRPRPPPRSLQFLLKSFATERIHSVSCSSGLVAVDVLHRIEKVLKSEREKISTYSCTDVGEQTGKISG